MRSHAHRLLLLAAPVLALGAGAARADDAFEPNDGFAQAQVLAPGHYTLEASDEDWFVLPALPPGQLRVDVPDANGQLSVALWRADAPDPAGPCTPSNGCLAGPPLPIDYPFVATASLYVQVKPANPGAGLAYTLEVSAAPSFPGDDASDDGPGNDSIVTATPVPPDLDVAGLVSLDQDFYAVQVLPGAFSACLEFDPSAGNVDLDLYDADFVRIAASAAPQPLTSEGCEFRGPPSPTANRRKLEWPVTREGVLYVATRGRDGVPYRLTLDLPTQWMVRLPYGPIRTSSITLADLDGDGSEEILVGTSKGLGPAPSYPEILPAALLCLEANGALRWAYSPPALAGPDPQTGLVYQTSSVSTTPAVGDVDGDGMLDVVFGAGADTGGEGDPFLRTGQPGDLGAVYAVDGRDGRLLWSRPASDRIGGPQGHGDGIPDGVYSTPLIVDLDGGSTPEVVYGGWDQRVRIVDGATGCVENGAASAAACAGPSDPCAVGGQCRDGSLVYDTVWSSPAAADVDGDGSRDLLIGSDSSTNPEAGTRVGGVFHVFDRFGAETIPGFDQEVNVAPTNPNYVPIRGKYEEQTLWSSPAAADFDGDGRVEIAYGTSWYGLLPSTLGRYVRVWNHDGSELRTFPTAGQTFASPLFADLTGDGTLELIAGDTSGRIYAWSRDSGPAAPLFATLTAPWAPPGQGPYPIVAAPLAVDLDGDGVLEILYVQGPQIVVVDAEGRQLSDPTRLRGAVAGFSGAPAVGDVDRDRILDIIAGGSVVGEPACTCTDLASCGCKRAVVFSFRWDGSRLPPDSRFRFARRMFRVPEPAGAAAAALAALAALGARRRAIAARPSAAVAASAASKDAFGISSW